MPDMVQNVLIVISLNLSENNIALDARTAPI